MDALTPAPTTLVHGEATFTADPEFRAPAFDVIEFLPPPAADRLRRLRLRAADAHMLMPEHAKLDEANLAKIAAERRLTQLTASAHDNGFNLPETDARVVAAKKTIDKTTADVRRLVELREARTSSWQVISRVAVNVEDWLRSGRPAGTMLEAVETDAKLNKGETVIDAIARLRKRAAELQASLQRIRSAPLPPSYAKQKARQQVEQLAQRGAANVSALLEQADGRLQFQRELLRVQMHNIPKAPGAVGYAEAIDPVAFLAWLDPQALIKKLNQEIDSKTDASIVSLTPEQRQQDEAAALADLLAAETTEAALVSQAQAANLPAEHRPDCSPLAILQCRLVTAPRALPSPASSPQHAYDLVGR